MIRACEKIKIDHRAKFLDKTIFQLRRFNFRFARFYEVFLFRCVARATFDRNLIHSADACFLVMVFVLHARARPYYIQCRCFDMLWGYANTLGIFYLKFGQENVPSFQFPYRKRLLDRGNFKFWAQGLNFLCF